MDGERKSADAAEVASAAANKVLLFYEINT
jgi:hypothetical protein